MNTKEPLVSVIIPVYGTEKYLKKCLSSVCDQTYKNLEILVVNDASPDDSDKIIEQFKREDLRVKSIVHSKNRGLFQARITGVEAAAGDYIAFVDSDDYIGIDWFRLLVKRGMNTGADITIGNTICEDENQNKYIYNTYYFASKSRECLYDKQIFESLMEGEGLCFSKHTVWNKLYSRKVWTKALPHFKTITQRFVMTEDIAFSTVLHYYAGKLAYSNHDGYFYFRNDSSSTVALNGLNKISRNIEDLMLSFTFVKKFMEEKGIYEKYKNEYANWKNRYFRWWSYPVESNTKNGTPEEIAVRKKFFDFFEKQDFEKVQEDDNFFCDVTTTWNDQLEELKKQICHKETECVSFDIFDTLILRPFLEPTDLFVFMEDYFSSIMPGNLSFKEARLYAEKQCRKKMRISHPAWQDVTLDEIYEQMEKEFHISQDKCRLFMEKEISLEKQFCVSRKTGKELYELAHYAGKRVILISDMYLPDRCVNAILEKNGYTWHEKLYLSSTERFLKYTGDLFRAALNDLQIQPQKILHIGDNWETDYIQPVKLEYKAFFMPKAKDILFNTLGDKYTGESIGATFNNTNSVVDLSEIMKQPNIRCLYALVANEIYDNPFVSFNPVSNYNRDAYFIGYFAVGMHLLGLCKWLAEELGDSDCQKIHFIARDGYLPKKIYDILQKYYSGLPASNYIYASRKSLIAASVRQPSDLYGIKDNIAVYNQTPETIYKVYAGVLSELDDGLIEKYRQAGIIMNKKFADEEELKFFIDKLIDFSYDKEKAQRSFETCSRYMKAEIGEGDVTFDLGYSGKLQSAICTALGFPVDTYYLHTNGLTAERQAKRKGFKTKSYYNFSPSMSGIVNEFIISEYNPSCVGYKADKGGRVRPVFENRETSYQEKYILDEISRGCENFVAAFYETFREYLDLFSFRPLEASLPYEKFLMNNKWFDINIFKSCYLEDEYYGGISRARLSEHWMWQINNRHLPFVYNAQNANTGSAAIPAEFQNMYTDGLFVSFYRFMNRKFPMGSKKRERVKKLAMKIMKSNLIL